MSIAKVGCNGTPGFRTDFSVHSMVKAEAQEEDTLRYPISYTGLCDDERQIPMCVLWQSSNRKGSPS